METPRTDERARARQRLATSLLALALAAFPPAARAETPIERLVFFVPNRVLDLLDVVHLSVSVGPGFGAMVRATRWVTAGYANLSVVRVGLHKRRGPAWDEHRVEAGLGPWYRHEGDPPSPTEITVVLHPLIAGLEAGVDPFSLVDFLAGFVFLDPEGDDRGADATADVARP